MQRAATSAIGVGLVGALGAAVTGLTDWSETDGESRRAGLIHATAFVLRRGDGDEGGTKCAWAGYAIALGAAYLGGDLVYGQRIGVTHAAGDQPQDYTRAIESAVLADNSMTRARVGDAVEGVRRFLPSPSRGCGVVDSLANLRVAALLEEFISGR